MEQPKNDCNLEPVSLTRAKDLPEADAMLEHVFKYHPPTELQIAEYGQLRLRGRDLAEAIIEHCPPSADRTVALRKVREAVMYANASVALGGKW